MTRASASNDRSRKPWLAGVVVLALLVAGVALGAVAGQDGLAMFGRHAAAMHEVTDRHPILSVSAFIVVFAAAMLAFIPVCLLLTVLAGFLFGAIPGALAAIVAATLAAAGGYSIGRSTFGGVLERRLGRRAEVIRKLARNLRRDAFSYILCLRLIPFSPFGLISLAAGSVHARRSRFLLATALGMAPECLIYAFAGHGLGAMISRGQTLSLHGLVRPELVWPVAGLAALYLAALVLRGVLARGESGEAAA